MPFTGRLPTSLPRSLEGIDHRHQFLHPLADMVGPSLPQSQGQVRRPEDGGGRRPRRRRRHVGRGVPRQQDAIDRHPGCSDARKTPSGSGLGRVTSSLETRCSIRSHRPSSASVNSADRLPLPVKTPRQPATGLVDGLGDPLDDLHPLAEPGLVIVVEPPLGLVEVGRGGPSWRCTPARPVRRWPRPQRRSGGTRPRGRRRVGRRRSRAAGCRRSSRRGPAAGLGASGAVHRGDGRSGAARRPAPPRGGAIPGESLRCPRPARQVEPDDLCAPAPPPTGRRGR